LKEHKHDWKFVSSKRVETDSDGYSNLMTYVFRLCGKVSSFESGGCWGVAFLPPPKNPRSRDT